MKSVLWAGAVGVAIVAVLVASPLRAQVDPKFGARQPAACPKVLAKPTLEQAAALVRCGRETKTERDLTLYEDIHVEMGGAQPYNFHAHSRLTGVDTTAKVYPIRGGYTYYSCGVARVYPALNEDTRGKNCTVSHVKGTTGYCWPTTFGDWSCSMTGTDGDLLQYQPPPR